MEIKVGVRDVPREVALALALVRRCRDLILYVPGLIVWQAQEGRWLAQKSKATRKRPQAS